MTTELESTDSRMLDGTMKIATPAEHFPLSRRDLSFIVGFWLLYALLTIANHVFDPGSPERRPDTSLTAWIMIAVTEAALWALLTPMIMSVVGRARPERMSRATYVLLLTLLGVVMALGVSVAGHLLRD
ncbi:MAG: hypothetical protein JJD97_05045, partial [Gemmatimonadaceae bacterium]|nr:hypothetical protein [Gemmatimonadaceae bacterium]